MNTKKHIHPEAVELIRLARKTNYEIAEGFRDADGGQELEMSSPVIEQMRAAAVALARASGVSVEVAQATVVEVALKEHLARMADDGHD